MRRDAELARIQHTANTLAGVKDSLLAAIELAWSSQGRSNRRGSLLRQGHSNLCHAALSAQLRAQAQHTVAQRGTVRTL